VGLCLIFLLFVQGFNFKVPKTTTLRLVMVKTECRLQEAALGFGAMASFMVRGGMP
jgi:hypothetical protein